jgi:hypothetical protein
MAMKRGKSVDSLDIGFRHVAAAKPPVRAWYHPDDERESPLS